MRRPPLPRRPAARTRTPGTPSGDAIPSALLVVLLVVPLVVGPATVSTAAAGAPASGAPPAVAPAAGTDAAGAADGTNRPEPGVVDYRMPLDPPADVVRGFAPPPAPWAAGHRGVDLRASPGAVVRAPASGTVTFAGTVAGRGVLTVTHDDGRRSSFEPVTATTAVGARVAAGDVVGTVDGARAAHCAPATCLHWGVRVGERYVDPLALLDDGPIVLLPFD